ncbi:glycoside hydrolase family 43 protein [Undibacterium pigrum]|uniref:Beta-xylosidase n=1 Tax=Undibacterium pigrum TaxID=401470 RepID=A0A318J813_9BURK|nr:glycoside hydrolase 43 family protein [Undibacterium pigrum]PXX44215.1 beta-xylosidase [Undibacterium pigrum]
MTCMMAGLTACLNGCLTGSLSWLLQACLLIASLTTPGFAAEIDTVKTSYQNPIIHADYSDPDVIRVADRYYMTSSSFNSAPGLPLLESADMVHWQLVGHALPQQLPLADFARPQHGNGVWAPCLRYHNHRFWIFYPDPDQGIYVMTAEKFSGPWSTPHLLLAGKGIIDPTPLWDDDGQAYLVHAWARSRAGFNNVLSLRRMNNEATRILDTAGQIIIDGNRLPHYKTLEGPKLYKHQGYYYIFAPAGGVEEGWQSVFRSRHIAGPYEDRIVMAQGTSPTNGPHQGAWVQTPQGTDWFYHFQDKRAYGRIVHLQPMQWKDGWPVIGADINNTGRGEPVLSHAMPLKGNFSFAEPATADEFDKQELGLQWQWNANWKAAWFSLAARSDHLRLYTQYDASFAAEKSLTNAPALLLQKLPSEQFTVDVKLDISQLKNGGSSGLILYGLNYAWLGVRQQEQGSELLLSICSKTAASASASPCTETVRASLPWSNNIAYLRMQVQAGGKTRFYYSTDQQQFIEIGSGFTASMGRWVGAQMGLFSISSDSPASANNFVDIDYFRVTRN